MPKRKDPPQPIRIELEADTSMPAVLAEVRRHVDESIVLVVPDHCPVLLTVAEFRALKDTAQRVGATVVIESNASLRTQLASMFGIRTAGGERNDHGWRPPDTLLGNTRSYETWVRNDDESEPQGRRRRRQHSDAPRQDNGEEYTSLDYIEDDSPSAIGATARKAGAILAIVVVVGLIATIAGWYALPNVTVVATVKSTSVSSEVNYAVAADGASLPSDIAFRAPAETSEAEVPFEISVPTTGVDRTPQDTASGEVILRNPTGEEITVPQGTTLTIYQGMSYTTDSDVTVGPAANNVAGEETVGVTASEPGSTGNAEPGMLTGVIPDLGIHFSNRDTAIEGGTDIEVAIVAEEDIQALEDTVINDSTRAAATGWTNQLPEGQAVVVPSVQISEPIVFEDYTVSAQPGEQAENISISGTVQATGLVYDQTVVSEKTTAFFRESLTSEVPEGYEIDPESVELGEPLALAPAPDNVQFRVSATATAYAVVDDDTLDSIRNDMSGSSMEEANARLEEVEQFESFDLSIGPSWWFERMPKDSGRIEIQVADPTDAPAQPSPEATAEE